MNEYPYSEYWEELIGVQDQLDVHISDDLPDKFNATVVDDIEICVTVTSRNTNSSEKTVKELCISPQLVDELYKWLHGYGEYDGWPETAFIDYEPSDIHSE